EVPELRARLVRARGMSGADHAGPAPAWLATAAHALQSMLRKRYAEARGLYEEALAAAGPEAERDAAFRSLFAVAHYNLGCAYALLSDGRETTAAPSRPVAAADAVARRDRAFAHLARSLELGFGDARSLAADRDLEPLRGDGRWAGLVAGGK
ncbi:MAG: hypothetical protein HYZ53_02855, partial [Planctomycetes bacterium]|nr:hypothetical protein [Planctomycetota bacterium]